MAAEHDVSYGDILRAIGNIEGKLDTIHAAMSSNRADIAEAFRRLNEAEKRIAQGVILAIVLSIAMPLLVTVANPRLHFGRPSDQSKHGVVYRESKGPV